MPIKTIEMKVVAFFATIAASEHQRPDEFTLSRTRSFRVLASTFRLPAMRVRRPVAGARSVERAQVPTAVILSECLFAAAECLSADGRRGLRARHERSRRQQAYRRVGERRDDYVSHFADERKCDHTQSQQFRRALVGPNVGARDISATLGMTGCQGREPPVVECLAGLDQSESTKRFPLRSPYRAQDDALPFHVCKFAHAVTERFVARSPTESAPDR